MSNDRQEQNHLPGDDLPSDDLVVEQQQPSVGSSETVEETAKLQSDADTTAFDELYKKWPHEYETVFPTMGPTHSDQRNVDPDVDPESLNNVVYIPGHNRELYVEQLSLQVQDGVSVERRHATVKSSMGHPRHGDVTQRSDKLYCASSAYNKTARRNDAEWRQMLEFNGQPLSIAKPKIGDAGEKLVGERAVERMRSQMGFAETVRVPLWHSGVWVTIRGPSDRDLIALFTQMRRDVSTLGRTTTGAVLSNQTVIHADTLIQFLRNYIVETSYHSLEEVLGIVKAQDFDQLMTGLAAAIYTRGFEFVRVLGDRGDNGEFNLVRARLSIPKCMWVDKSMLSERQIRHMTLRASGSMTKQAVEDYQNGFPKNSNRIRPYVLSTGREVKIELAQPFLHEWLANGQLWIAELQELVTRTLGIEADEETRSKEISKLARSTYLRLYSHWVVGIEVGGISTSDREQGAIDKLLDELSSDDNVINQFPADVGEYIDDTTVSMVATTALTEAEAATHKRFPHLVPINVLATFFQLLSQKARRIDPVLTTSEGVM